MKQASAAQKAPHPTAQSADSATSAGPGGIAFAPPAYGIDFVDQQSAAVTPEPGQEQQALDVIQMQSALSVAGSDAGARPEHRNGLPDELRAGIERLSGLAMDDVRVHYNSAKPAHVQALAYTQGSQIFVGPGQERHLPHEAWHVVQQQQGRVEPTIQMAGAVINDDARLEKEADVMGTKALRRMVGNRAIHQMTADGQGAINLAATIQRKGSILTFNQADPTVDTQQTNAEVTVNSETLGKVFREGGTLDDERTTVLNENGFTYNGHAELKIIAEYLLQVQNGLLKNPLFLSIRLNRAPCGECAKSLVKLKKMAGIAIRVKASSITQKDGIPILEKAGIPFRLWTREQRETKEGSNWAVKTIDQRKEKLSVELTSERLLASAKKKRKLAKNILERLKLESYYNETYKEAQSITNRDEVLKKIKSLKGKVKKGRDKQTVKQIIKNEGNEKLKTLISLQYIYESRAKELQNEIVLEKGETREYKYLERILEEEANWKEYALEHFPKALGKWPKREK